jgi:hypothetical protein
MPEAAARAQRTDQTLLHLFLDSNCYTKVNGIVQGENQNGYLTCSAGILGAARAVIFKHVVPLPRPHERRRRRSGAKVQIGCNDLQGADLSRRLLHGSAPKLSPVDPVSMGTTS